MVTSSLSGRNGKGRGIKWDIRDKNYRIQLVMPIVCCTENVSYALWFRVFSSGTVDLLSVEGCEPVNQVCDDEFVLRTSYVTYQYVGT